MADIAKIVEEVKTLTVLELNDLVKALEEELGVRAGAAVAAPAAGGAAPTAQAEEEKTEFDVVLTSAGGNKIAVIKAVREIVSGISLVDAKAMVEGTPKAIKEGVSKEVADQIAEKLKAAGAEVEIK